MPSNLAETKLAFKERFSELMSEYNDPRTFDILSIGQDGKFSAYFSLINQLNAEDMGLCYVFADEESIEVYFNEILMMQMWIMSSQEIFSKTEDFLNNAMKQVAEHEYAHLITTPNTLVDVFPENIRNEIAKNKLITIEQIIHQFTEGEILKEHKFLQYQEYLTHLRITNVNIIFREFDADYIAYIKLTDQIPAELMELRLVDISKVIDFFTSKGNFSILHNNSELFYDRILRLISLCNIFIIFDEYDIIERVFETNNLSFIGNYIIRILEHLKTNYDFYEKLSDMEIEILKMALDMDQELPELYEEFLSHYKE